jgi:purine-binding chemotaxis protein CheW
VVFQLDTQRYALQLAAVDRIVRAVEVTPLPGAPDIVLGAITVEGRVLPVLDIRRRFRLAEREIRIEDQIVIAQTTARRVALVIDEACDVIERDPSASVGANLSVPRIEPVEGVIELDDGLVFIHDLDKFLSPDETRTLDRAMHGAD